MTQFVKRLMIITAVVGGLGVSVQYGIDESVVDSLPRKAVSTTSEAGSGYVLVGVQWNNPNVTYAFANCPSGLDCATAQNAVREAFWTWTSSCGINFSETTGPADVMVSWQTGAFGLDIDFDGPGGYLAIGRPPYYGGNHELDGDIFFDDQEAWYISGVTSGGQYNLRSTALHEIGHTVGLNHSSASSTIMWYSDNGMTSLSAADVAGCQALYGS